MIPGRCALICVGMVVVMATMGGARAHAQELEPRAYANTPVGLNFLIAGYVHSSGSVVVDPSIPLQDAKVDTDNAVLAYVRSLDVFGNSGKLAVVLPYSWASGTATFEGEARAREVSGLGDPKLIFSVNLYGAPALSLEEFVDYQQDLIAGASFQISAPLGQYDSDKLLNIGTNRWSFRPEIGLSKAWGPFTVELAAGATFYTSNDDFLGRTLQLDPLVSVQGHLLHTFPWGIWGALDAVYYRGGRTTIDGVQGDNVQEAVRVGGTLALPLNRYNSLKLYGSTTVYSRTGTRYDLVGIAWQLRWGAGL
jgi:hypothetical protein